MCHRYLDRDILGSLGGPIYRCFDWILGSIQENYEETKTVMKQGKLCSYYPAYLLRRCLAENPRAKEWLAMTKKQQESYQESNGEVGSIRTYLWFTPPFLLLLEAWYSSTRRCLSDVRDAKRTDEYIDRMTEAAPDLCFESETYYKDGDGGRRVTSRAGWDVAVNKWTDMSSWALSPLKRRPHMNLKWQWRLSERPLVKVKLGKALLFQDKGSGDTYYDQLAFFTGRNKGKTKGKWYQGTLYHTVTPRFRLAGDDCDGQFLAARDDFGDLAASSVNLFSFWLTLFLGLTVPYRIWLESQCGFATLTVVKEVSFDPPAPLSGSTEEPIGEKPDLLGYDGGHGGGWYGADGLGGKRGERSVDLSDELLGYGAWAAAAGPISAEDRAIGWVLPPNYELGIIYGAFLLLVAAPLIYLAGMAHWGWGT